MKINILTTHESANPNKRFVLKDGVLVKGDGPNMAGPFTLASHEYNSLGEFGDLLQFLEGKPVALVHGEAMAADGVSVVTKARVKGDAIARSREYFRWRESAAVMMVDLDLENEIPDLDSFVRGFMKDAGLDDYSFIYQASSSSNIIAPDGSQVKGCKGAHIYLLVENQSETPEIADILFQRLILAGKGFIKISASGAALVRSPMDASVYQPERIDFVAGAVLPEGYTQKRPVVRVGGARDALSLAAIGSLSDREKRTADATIARLIEDAKPEAEKARRIWIDDAKTPQERLARERAKDGALTPDFMMRLKDGSVVAVRDIVADQVKYDGAEVFDPDNGEMKAKLFFNGNGSVILYSFANGGKTWRLLNREAVAYYESDPVKNTDAIHGAMRKAGEFFIQGDQLVRVTGKIEYFVDESSRNRLRIDFAKNHFAFKMGNTVDIKRQDFIDAIDSAPDADLPVLNSVKTTPRYDVAMGELIGCARGYAPDTRDFYVNASDISLEPDFDTKTAYSELLKPFEGYSFASDDDKASLLAAMFLMVVRSHLAKAPAVVVHTPPGGQSSGKTPMCEALLKIGGWKYAVVEYGRGGEPFAKRLAAHAITQGSRAMLLDNVLEGRAFDSPELAAYLTSDEISNRILGSSRSVISKTNFPVLITQNMFSPSRDLAVRMIDVELRKGEQAFDWVPADRIDTPRFQHLVLNIIHAYHKAGNRFSSKNNKFGKDYDDYVVGPVRFLTGVDITRKTERLAGEADVSDKSWLETILDRFWRSTIEYAPENKEFAFGRIRSFVENDPISMDILKSRGLTPYALKDKLMKYAETESNPMGGEYGEYVLAYVKQYESRAGVYSLTKREETLAVKTRGDRSDLTDDEILALLEKAESRQAIAEQAKYKRSSDEVFTCKTPQPLAGRIARIRAGFETRH